MPNARILLVDDRPENLIAFEAALEGLGHTLVRAGSGAEAVQQVIDNEFAVILLDVMMPGMDGLETARLIRGAERAADTPILFITAMTHDPAFQVEAYASGAVDYLYKPVDPYILRAKVAAYVELWGKSRAARATSEARRAAVLEAALDAIITIDHEGRIIEWNPSAERIFGHERADAVGRIMGDLIVPRAQRGRHRRGLARYVASGVPKLLGQRLEMTALRADGTEFPVELAITRIPMAGSPLFAGYVRDITDRKRTEERFRQLAEHIREVFWMSDPRKREILYVSPAYEELWGRTCASLYEEPSSFLEAIHPEDRGAALAALETQAGGEASEAEYRVVRPDGSVRWIHDRAFPIRDESGTVYRFAGLAEDITDRKQAEQALRQQSEELLEADRQKNLYLAMLSHELRNPVGAIGNASHLLSQIGSQEERAANVRGIIDRQVRHLARIVDDLLDVSRLTHGLIELRKDWVDLGAVVEEAVETSAPLIEAKGHQLALSLTGEPITVHADPARLQQIITNLLDNAAKYTPAGGRISLTVETQPENDVETEGWDRQRALIRVRDTGVGMAPELLPRVFDIFTQAERPLDRTDGGLGIGLSLVRSLVEMHGGSVQASSEGPAKGSEFVVSLPVAEPRAKAPPSVAPSIVKSAPRGSRRVLVVEDNVDAAVTLAELLEEWGYVVHVAHSGETGIEAAFRHRPQILLLDIGLPGIDGYEVARRLRREPAFEGVLLLALTGYGKPDDRRCAEEAGIDHHLTKPVDLEALRGLLAGELVR